MTSTASSTGSAMAGLDGAPPFDADEYQAVMNRMSAATERFAGTFANAMRDGVIHGRSFDEALNRIALRLASIALDEAMRPFQSGLADLLATATRSAQPAALATAPGFGQQGHGLLPQAPQVNMNIYANDARGFRNSRGQLFAALTGIMSQGLRNL